VEELLGNLCKCQDLWPALKLTTQLTIVNDLSLLPRALQCDEDLGCALNEYRSILAARQLQTEELLRRREGGGNRRAPYSTRPIHQDSGSHNQVDL